MNEERSMLDRGWDYDYELTIWVQCDKSFDEFRESMASIIDPLKITDGKFSLGGIACEIEAADLKAPEFEGIPDEEYQHRIIVDTDGAMIWSCFSRQFALSLALGIRTKFLSSYLVTNDQDTFVLYSGSHKPLYYNPEYESWKNGEFSTFLTNGAVGVST